MFSVHKLKNFSQSVYYGSLISFWENSFLQCGGLVFVLLRSGKLECSKVHSSINYFFFLLLDVVKFGSISSCAHQSTRGGCCSEAHWKRMSAKMSSIAQSSTESSIEASVERLFPRCSTTATTNAGSSSNSSKTNAGKEGKKKTKKKKTTTGTAKTKKVIMSVSQKVTLLPQQFQSSNTFQKVFPFVHKSIVRSSRLELSSWWPPQHCSNSWVHIGIQCDFYRL